MENDRCTNVDSVINPELAPLNIKTALEENDIDTINKGGFQSAAYRKSAMDLKVCTRLLEKSGTDSHILLH